MKKKIIGYLALLFGIFAVGAAVSILYITLTTSELRRIITLHSVEILRQDLIIKIQNVEQDLLTVHTEFGRHLDGIVQNVMDLDRAVHHCSSCHHSPLITRKLSEIRDNVGRFETTLSHYITASANEERITSLKRESYDIGTELLAMTSEMAFIANQKLQERTTRAIRDVESAQQILIGTILASSLFALWISTHLTKKIIAPIRELIAVARRIASGNLGSTTALRDDTEFGELASSMNDMSLSLEESNRRIVENLNRLSGLYRVTLLLHSVTSVPEIVKEVTFGLAELIGVKQCGILMLDEDSGVFQHAFPAFGLGEEQVRSIRISREELNDLYVGNNRRPFLASDPAAEKLPAGIIGADCDVRDVLLGWIRRKGELVGAIRLANKDHGDFGEESARLVAIVSNNISVAFENVALYESLRHQMEELKETQMQLVQAEKLAAIGELASNVAHEINNPLTSIMGYAELIREEEDIGNIMRDVEIIEKESLRARDIVQQLLEFARKRPLEVKKVDLNGLMGEVVSLMRVQMKDSRVLLREEYAGLPQISGDENQLKQVFLNIIKNAVDAMPENGGEVRIATGKDNSHVFVDISDNGQGIPQAVLPRIFEPFFTTKREKGTGLGLSVSYRIVQSHRGKIDVKSEAGKGAKFTVSLPIYMTG